MRIHGILTWLCVKWTDREVENRGGKCDIFVDILFNIRHYVISYSTLYNDAKIEDFPHLGKIYTKLQNTGGHICALIFPLTMRDIFYEGLDLPARTSANEFSSEDLRIA